MLEEVRRHVAELTLIRAPAGEVLLAAGTRSGRLLFLETGRLAVRRGGIIVTRVRQPGAVFGEMSLLLDAPHTADVVALEDSTCRLVEAAGDYLLRRPEMMAYVAAVLAHRLDAATRYLVDVKTQFADSGSHLGMIDEVLDSLVNRHPRGLAAAAGG